jgi:hypothetical protein
MDMTDQPAPTGCLDGMPSAEYHAVEAMSASGGKKILRTPAHFRLMRNTPSVPTPQMQFGTVVHDGVLEPDKFHARVGRVPNDAPSRPTSRQINAAKPSAESVSAIQYWRLFDKENGGKIILSAEDYARAGRCIDAVHSHPAARHMLTGGIIERSLFWRDRLFDVPCKARLDISNHGGIIDLKTCEDASPEGFSRAIGTFDYSLQGWSNFSGSEHVLDATPEFFAFICVETSEPHCVKVYQLGRESLMLGARQWDECLARYKAALDAGKWEGYPPTIDTINAPRWKLRHEA